MTTESALNIAGFRGRTITPGDPDYDGARAVFYGGFDKRPRLIARAKDAADVARVVRYARDNGIQLAVRSGGHSNAGHCTTDGGIVLDLKDMRALDIDVAGRTAWVEPGLTAGEYTTAAAAHGLATSFGDTGSVGIGGLVLGGGVGYLVRKHGLTIDALLEADVVTADGELHRVNDGSEKDLFWAIRGGGGNFGVATRFQLRLSELGAVFGGFLILPATPQVIQSFMRLAEAAPDELTAIANVMPAPPMPFLPAEHHGKVVVLAMLVYAGAADAGTRAIAPFRALATPLVDMLKPMTYPEVYPPDDPSYHPIAAGRTMFADTVDGASAESIVAHLTQRAPEFGVAQLRALGGAMARVPVDATAFAHRKRRIMINIGALYEKKEEAPRHERWVAEFGSSLRRGDDGAYVNFLATDGPGRIHEAYPGKTWDRLVQIKRRYDPQNLFRLNQNIAP